MTKAKIEYWFRNKILLTIASWIDDYYGDKICWARLVIWALYETNLEQFEHAMSGVPECASEIDSNWWGCYCGHFSNWSMMPYISLEFIIKGAR